MRCVYCGAELALFKRLTGGGEFCSEAHRLLYQEEYNRLALARLLPMPATTEERAPLMPRVETVTAVSVEEPEPVPAVVEHEITPVEVSSYRNGENGNGHYEVADAVATPESPAEPEPVVEEDAIAPAPEADFIWELPYAVSTDMPKPSAASLELMMDGRPQVPVRENPAFPVGLAEAAPVELAEEPRMRDQAIKVSPSRSELRESPAQAPNLGVLLRPAARLRIEDVPEAMKVQFAFAQPGEVAGEDPEPITFVRIISFDEDLKLSFATTGFGEVGEASHVAEIAAATDIHKLGNGILDMTGESASAVLEADPAPVSETADPVVAVEAPEPQLQTELVSAEQVVAQEVVTEAVEPAHVAEVVEADVVEVPVLVAETKAEISAVPAPAVEIATTTAVEEPEPAVNRVQAPVGFSAPLPVTVFGASPSNGSPQPVYPAQPVISFSLQKPRVAALPLRPLMTLGPKPEQGPKIADDANTAVATAVAEPPKPATRTETKQEKSRAAIRAELRANGRMRGKGRPPESKSTGETVTPDPIEEKVVVDTPEVKSPVSVPEAAAQVVESKSSKVETPATEVVEAKVETKTVETRIEESKQSEEPKGEKPKPTEPKPETKKSEAKKSEESKPEQAKPEAKKSPAAEPVAATPEPKKAKSEAESTAREAAPTELPSMFSSKLQSQPSESFFSRLPLAVKALAAVLVLAAAGGAIYFTSSGSSNKKSGRTPVSATDTLVPGSLVGDTGWSNDWLGDAGSRKGRQLAIYRASQNVADYRFELQAQIENKSVAWAFRAKNPQNYHVAKLEVLKPGLNPTVALVRFSVVDGEESARTQIPLPMPVRVDTVYKIRTEARGDKFGIWVNDQLIQEWTDSRIHVGGVGIFNERNERASVRNIVVTQLVPKK
jgi:hypothetical protein